jgi:hypothetical protein
LSGKNKHIVRNCEGLSKAKYGKRAHDAVSHTGERRTAVMTRYCLDPMFDRTPDGAVKGIMCYHIYLDGRFVGTRRTHALCHDYLDELMPSIPEPGRSTGTIHALPLPVGKGCKARRMIIGQQ